MSYLLTNRIPFKDPGEFYSFMYSSFIKAGTFPKKSLQVLFAMEDIYILLSHNVWFLESHPNFKKLSEKKLLQFIQECKSTNRCTKTFESYLYLFGKDKKSVPSNLETDKE
jgi:hypothetical protein